MEPEKQIEAVLFWRGEPMTFPELCRALKIHSSEVKKGLASLKEKLSGRGIILIETPDAIALGTASETHELIERLRKEELSRELGKAALETLAIVLYKGQVSRRDIEYIRGVNSTAIVRSLLIRGLIERTESELDDFPVPQAARQAGRGFLYKPTIELYSLLGISSVGDLPEYAALQQELSAAKDTQEKAATVESDEIAEAAAE